MWLQTLGYFVGGMGAFILLGYIFNHDFWTRKSLAVFTGTGTILIGIFISPLFATYFFMAMAAIIVNCTKYSYDKS